MTVERRRTTHPDLGVPPCPATRPVILDLIAPRGGPAVTRAARRLADEGTTPGARRDPRGRRGRRGRRPGRRRHPSADPRALGLSAALAVHRAVVSGQQCRWCGDAWPGAHTAAT
ncbi:hypothetical protein [Streptomyces zaehneri]|uniref:hypothetical protein n=1 Tax=Streptomyces zaehneri TaxID=3051180 RepID=UPI0028D59389|nr:hypothetical protein [Streptomyces sp. DSM 40713]